MTKHNDNQIIVSISCITYNHAPYIRQCLDGFLMQQTNFAYEVLIHDDASTDGTTEIIKEYEAKYPDIIKPIYEDENQWVKGRRGSAVFNFPRAKGKYIAMCEGDDYWTDSLKLQKQVDFLETHDECSFCAHNFDLYNQDTECLERVRRQARDFTMEDLVTGDLPIQTATILGRKESIDLDFCLRLPFAMDATLFYQMLKCGKCRIFEDIMSVYRVHSSGIWSGALNVQHVDLRLRVVKSIYDIEQNNIAARYLLNQYSKGVGRKWMIMNPTLNLKILDVCIKHFGVKKTLYFLYRKLFWGNNVVY